MSSWYVCLMNNRETIAGCSLGMSFGCAATHRCHWTAKEVGSKDYSSHS